MAPPRSDSARSRKARPARRRRGSSFSTRPACASASAREWQKGLLPGRPNSTCDVHVHPPRQRAANGHVLQKPHSSTGDCVFSCASRDAMSRSDVLANVSPDVVGRRQRRTTLHPSVGFDSERRYAGPAAVPDVAAVAAVAKRFRQRAKIADIVAREERDPVRIEALPLDRGQQGKEMEQVIGLQVERRTVGRPAHGHGEDHHPAARADLDQEIGNSRKLRHGEPVHLCVDGKIDPACTDPPRRRYRRLPGPDGAADGVVGPLAARRSISRSCPPRPRPRA